MKAKDSDKLNKTYKTIKKSKSIIIEYQNKLIELKLQESELELQIKKQFDADLWRKLNLIKSKIERNLYMSSRVCYQFDEMRNKYIHVCSRF